MVYSHASRLPFSDRFTGVDRMIHSLAFELDTEFYDIEILESTSTDGTIRYTVLLPLSVISI